MDKNYISLIKKLREQTGWSQEELASRIGVTFAALNRWLRGHAVPHPRRLLTIEKLYRQTVAFAGFDEPEVRRIVKDAEKFRGRQLWQKLKNHTKLQEDLLLEHTYNSSTIEGTTFTKHETETVIFSKKVIKDKSLSEHLEVTNHAAVLREILTGEWNVPISEKAICEIHLRLMQGIRKDAGRYSRLHRAIRGVDLALTHPDDIPEEMAGLVRRWSRHKKATIREIAVFHAEFEAIHPFGDGNGRVGRLIMALQCLQNGFPPVIVENARKAEYYEVLEYAQTRAEGPLIAFLADELAQTHKIFRKHRV